jgi:glycerol-1-phosphate dehydrogenase [NAD(P)+]
MQTIPDLLTYYSLTPTEYANTVFHCTECGRDHKIPFEVVHSGDNLLLLIPEIVTAILEGTPNNIGIIYDQHIENKLGPLFFIPFAELELPFTRLPIGQKGHLLEASVEAGDQVADKVPEDIDVLIGVGSGVICDLTKWIATKRNVPFLIMGTAASMNAYTSITGTMTENKVKSTRWLNPAKAVLMDSALIASAPHEMTCAGVGDLLARKVANADWRLSHLLRGTFFCPVPYLMMKNFQDQFLPVVGQLKIRNLGAIQKLSDAILASGYSMTILDGETSPSSGSEHIISHFFDFQHEIFGKPKNLHGAQVGIGTIIMSTAFEILHEMDPSQFDIDKITSQRLSQTAIQVDNQRIFGDYHGVFDQVVDNKHIPENEFRAYISNIINSWEKLWQEIQPYLMPAYMIREAMTAVGGSTKLVDVQRTTDDALQALLYGSRYRPRYTILDLFWELGLFPQYAQIIIEKSGVLGQ